MKSHYTLVLKTLNKTFAQYLRQINLACWQSVLLGTLFFILTGCASRQTPSSRIDYPTLENVVQQADPRLAEIVPDDAVLEQIASGFAWAEGPVWVSDGSYLLFTDSPNNTIYKWSEKTGLRVFLRPAGYTGPDPPGEELGANGLLLDAEGRLVMCDQGNRAISRLNEDNFTKTVLVDNYQGKSLNSPNDAVYAPNGDLYFTDPPYGLAGLNDNPLKELDFNGVYLFSADSTLTLLTRDLTFPNGIALSPDGKTLYVANSDPQHPVWTVYDVRPDGTIENGRVFFDASEWVAQGKQGMPDGMTIDQQGNLYASGPGGIHIFSPEGDHLGLIATPQPAANCTFGGAGGSTLFITSDAYLYRIRLNTKGLGFKQ